MLRLNAAAFQNAVSALARIRAEVMALSKPRTDSISPTDKLFLHIHLTQLKESLTTIGCIICNKSVKELLALLDHDNLKHSYLVKQLGHIDKTMGHELEEKFVVVISPETASYFEAKEPLFGPEVSAKFPSTLYELEEAGKCLALDRSTAAAFHAIRCLEAGIRAVCRSLAIPDPTKGSERNWSIILQKMNAAMDAKWPRASRIHGDGKTFEEIVGKLGAITNPYRNATMHLDAKYTTEEAMEIFFMVKGIMKSIATRIDENGNPPPP